jgi:hypothetical protein
MRLLALLLLVTPAFAADGGSFDRDTVVDASAAFRSVAASQASSFGPIERALETTDRALAELDLDLALTRGSMDKAQHDLSKAVLDERSNKFGDEFNQLQGELDQISGGYEQAFEAALTRALAAMPGVQECKQTGGVLGGLTGPSSMGGAKDDGCAKPDRSAEIARAWDADPELKAELDRLAAAWPSITTYSGAEPVRDLGAGTEGWFSPANLTDLVPEAIELLDAIERKVELVRDALRAERAGLNPEDEGAVDAAKSIAARARAAREWGEDRKAELGATLWAALDKQRKKAGKKGGWAAAGACLNPTAWGACEGTDHTDAIAETLHEDKKLLKALAKQLEGLGAPE